MKLKIVAALTVIVLIAGLFAGCGAKNDYIATLNDEKIPIGYYTVYMLFTRVQYENYYGDGYDAFMAATDSSSDKTNGELLDETAKAAFEQLYLLKLKVKELGLEIDELTKLTFEGEYDYYKKLFRSESDYKLFLKRAGMTEEEHHQIFMEKTCYQDLIYNYYFDETKGIERYTDEDIYDYYLSLVDYATQHILFAYPTTGSDGADLDKDTLTQYRLDAKAEAEETLDKIRSGAMGFDDAVNELSDDSSLALYPDGYGFKEGDGSLPGVFTQAAKELDIGDYAVYESEYGFHIIERLDLEAFFELQKDTYELAYTTEYLTDLMAQWAEGLDFKYNEAALSSYSMTSTKRTNIALSDSAFS